MEGKGRERSRSSGHAVSQRAGGNHVARENVRVANKRAAPERGGLRCRHCLAQQLRRRREEAAGAKPFQSQREG